MPYFEFSFGAVIKPVGSLLNEFSRCVYFISEWLLPFFFFFEHYPLIPGDLLETNDRKREIKGGET